MSRIPICANFVERSCERSDTYVSKETDTVFVITCRTCKGISVWPKTAAEDRAKYQNVLHEEAQQREKLEAESRQRLYSIAGTRPGEKV